MALRVDDKRWITITKRSGAVGGGYFRLGVGAPQITEGYGGWEEVSRPLRGGFADWKGQPLLKMTLPLLLDGVGVVDAQGKTLPTESVEFWIRELESLAGVNGGQPDVLQIRAVEGFRPVPHMLDRDWVITGLDWQDDTWRRSSDGRVIRQSVMVSLMEYESADIKRGGIPKSVTPKRHLHIVGGAGRGGKHWTWQAVAKFEHLSVKTLKEHNPKVVKLMKKKNLKYIPVGTYLYF